MDIRKARTLQNCVIILESKEVDNSLQNFLPPIDFSVNCPTDSSSHFEGFEVSGAEDFYTINCQP